MLSLLRIDEMSHTNNIRTQLLREGTTDQLIRKFFKLFVEAIRRLCEATGVEFTEP